MDGIVTTAAQAMSPDVLEMLRGVLPDSAFACLTAAVAVCAAAAMLLPAPRPESGRLYRLVYTLINWVACNLGRARNAQDARRKPSVWKP